MDASLQFGSVERLQVSIPLGKGPKVVAACIKQAIGETLFNLRCARRVWSSLIAVVFIGLAAGCVKDGQVSATPAPGPPKLPVHLGVGDVVRLTFPATPELNQSHKVRTDGKINAPLIGEVDAAGKRLAAFQDELTLLYKPQLKNNEVIVTLESSPVPIYVSGAVSKPGKIILDRPMTVLEAIMEAGGFGPMANMKKVRIIRLTKGEHHTMIVDLNPAMTGRTTPANYVRADDVIYVPERAVNF